VAGHVESRSHGDRSLRGSAPVSTGTGKAPGSARLGHGTPRVQAERLLDRVDPPSRPAWPRCTEKLGVGLEANLLGDMPKAAVAADLFTSCSRSYRHRTSAQGVGAHASSQQQYLLSWHEFQHAVASAFPSSFRSPTAAWTCGARVSGHSPLSRLPPCLPGPGRRASRNPQLRDQSSRNEASCSVPTTSHEAATGFGQRGWSGGWFVSCAFVKRHYRVRSSLLYVVWPFMAALSVRFPNRNALRCEPSYRSSSSETHGDWSNSKQCTTRRSAVSARYYPACGGSCSWPILNIELEGFSL
jgi:hypothetical protein